MNHIQLIKNLVNCIEQLMPGVGATSVDIGLLNDTLIAADRIIKKPDEGKVKFIVQLSDKDVDEDEFTSEEVIEAFYSCMLDSGFVIEDVEPYEKEEKL